MKGLTTALPKSCYDCLMSKTTELLGLCVYGCMMFTTIKVLWLSDVYGCMMSTKIELLMLREVCHHRVVMAV